MNKNIDCNIVQDLLPSYMDNLTSAPTNNSIEQHMQDCEPCKKMLEDLTKEIRLKDSQEAKEINFLKKINAKQNIIKLCCVGLVAILICIGIQKLFSLRFPASVGLIVITDVEQSEGNGEAFFTVNTNNPFFSVHSAKFLPEKGTDVVYMTFFYKLRNPFIKQTSIFHGLTEESIRAYGYTDYKAIRMVDDDGSEKVIWEKK